MSSFRFEYTPVEANIQLNHCETDPRTYLSSGRLLLKLFTCLGSGFLFVLFFSLQSRKADDVKYKLETTVDSFTQLQQVLPEMVPRVPASQCTASSFRALTMPRPTQVLKIASSRATVSHKVAGLRVTYSSLGESDGTSFCLLVQNSTQYIASNFGSNGKHSGLGSINIANGTTVGLDFQIVTCAKLKPFFLDNFVFTVANLEKDSSLSFCSNETDSLESQASVARHSKIASFQQDCCTTFISQGSSRIKWGSHMDYSIQNKHQDRRLRQSSDPQTSIAIQLQHASRFRLTFTAPSRSSSGGNLYFSGEPSPIHCSPNHISCHVRFIPFARRSTEDGDDRNGVALGVALGVAVPLPMALGLGLGLGLGLPLLATIIIIAVVKAQLCIEVGDVEAFNSNLDSIKEAVKVTVAKVAGENVLPPNVNLELMGWSCSRRLDDTANSDEDEEQMLTVPLRRLTALGLAVRINLPNSGAARLAAERLQVTAASTYTASIAAFLKGHGVDPSQVGISVKTIEDVSIINPNPTINDAKASQDRMPITVNIPNQTAAVNDEDSSGKAQIQTTDTDPSKNPNPDQGAQSNPNPSFGFGQVFNMLWRR